jgi:hypothetical protein
VIPRPPEPDPGPTTAVKEPETNPHAGWILVLVIAAILLFVIAANH